MTVRLAPALAVLGILIAIFGAVAGFAPIHRQGVSCGSVFHPDTSAASVADLTNAMRADAFGADSVPVGLSAVSNACDAARSDRKPLALSGVIPGGLLALLGWGIAAREHWGAEQPAEAGS